MGTTVSESRLAAEEQSSASDRSLEHVVPVAGARAIFIDLARVIAILMMLQGHTLHVVLSSDLRVGLAFQVWSFMRGLTSGIFLLLAGFVFTVAANYVSTDRAAAHSAVVRRVRRFGFFLVLGYALHFPVAQVAELRGASDEQWQSFLAVDVLQCVAVMLMILQGLVLLFRTPRRFACAAALGCAALVTLTPLVWGIDWTGRLPGVIAAYLGPGTGSLFPVFPWGAYPMLGAVLATVYLDWHRDYLVSYANRVLLGGGLGMLIIALFLSGALQPFGLSDYWPASLNPFLLRSGLVLLVLGLVAHVSRLATAYPTVVQALARESLLIYAVHLCIVYGSVWNVGLRQLVGPTQPLLPALGLVVLVWGSMVSLALGWHWCKQRQPGIAQWVRVSVPALLFGRLL